MVHKPGLAEHDFDHLPEASFPIATLPGFIDLHERIAGLVAPSKVVAVALNTSLYRDDDEARRLIAAIAAETGLPTDDPFRFGAGPAVGGDPRGGRRAAVGRRRAGEPARSTHEVLHLGLRDPFRIARTDHALGDARDDRRRRAARRPVPGRRRGGGGLPGPVLRRDAGDDGRGLPVSAGLADGFAVESRRRRRRRGGARGARRDLGGRPALDTAAPSAPSTSPCTTSSARSSASRSTSCSACRPTSRRPTSRSASTSPAIVAERAARAADFPALKIKCGGPQDLETLRAVRARLRRSDPGRRQHRLDARRRRARCCPSSSRLGVELIEQPFPARAYRDLALAPGALVAPDRRRRERGHRRGPRRARRRRRRRQRQARQVRRHRPRQGGCSSARASSASGPSSAAWRRRRSGSPASAVVASLADWVDLDGCLLLADDPFEGLELDADHRWILPDAARSRADPAARLTRRPRTDRTGVR